MIAETRETTATASRPRAGGMNVWLVGHAGCYNRGCEAIVRATARLLDERFGSCRYTVLSNDPTGDFEQFDTARFRVFDRNTGPSRLDLPWFATKLRRLPGGGPAHSLLRRLPGWPACGLSIGGDNFTMDYGSPKSFMVEVRRLIAAGIPVAIWGASVGPFTADPKLEARVVQFLRQVDVITVRETASIDYLRSLGIERNVRRVWDPAFALKPQSFDGPETALFESGDVVGLNLSALIARWFPDENLDAMLDEMAGFVRGLLADGHRVLLVPHVTNPNGPLYSNDEEVLRRLMERVRATEEQVRLLPGSLSAAQLKGMIARCRFFVGARTHSTIAAFSSAVPTVAIGYSQKARGICRDLFDNEDYLVPTRELTAQRLAETFERLVRDEAHVRSLLKQWKPEMLAGARRNVEALEEILRT